MLVTIGSNKDTVKRHVESVEHIAGVEVLGLVVSQAHDSYEMFVRQSAEVKGPFFCVTGLQRALKLLVSIQLHLSSAPKRESLTMYKFEEGINVLLLIFIGPK